MTKIAILGSCVSRDALEFADPDDFNLVSYFARSSLASLASRPANLPSTAKQVLNNFRLRMVAADHDKTTPRKLADLDYDVLILDLIDERFNLLEQSDGSIVTLSTEYMVAVGNKPVGRVVKSGSERHIDLWRKGVGRLLEELSRSGKLDKLLVNKLYWAKKDNQGGLLNVPDFQNINHANQFLSDRYSDLDDYIKGCKFISYPENLFLADLSHKWGLSPFHYEKNLYLETLRQIRGINEDSRGIQEVLHDSIPWRVTLEARGGGGTWTARIHDYKANGGDEFAFYLMRGKERIAMKWYSSEPAATFGAPVARGEYHAVGFVRCNQKSPPEFHSSDVISHAGSSTYDLAQWKCSVFESDADEGFFKKNPLQDGIYKFRTERSSVDIKIDGVANLKPDGVVLVCFGGSVPKRMGKTAPFFSGSGIARNLDMPVLSVADPSLSLSDSLALGWYAGNHLIPDLQKKIAFLLDSFSETYGVKLIMFGGSGGGFASLAIQGLMKSSVTVAVWNPQTAISRYLPAAAIGYVETAFPSKGVTDVDQVGTRLEQVGVFHDLAAKRPPCVHSVLYLQNQSDAHHIKHHAIPFARSRGVFQISDTVLADAGNLAMWFGCWGKGHAVPPADMILFILRRLAIGGPVINLARELEGLDPGCSRIDFDLN